MTFAWTPTIVRIWSTNYKDSTIIWLRYYDIIENKEGYESLSGGKSVVGLKYIVRKNRTGWFI